MLSIKLEIFLEMLIPGEIQMPCSQRVLKICNLPFSFLFPSAKGINYSSLAQLYTLVDLGQVQMFYREISLSHITEMSIT